MSSGDEFMALGVWEVVTMLLAVGGGIAFVAALVYLIMKVLDR